MLRGFKVGRPSEGTRLDLFLVSACSDLSRSRIARLIDEGAARVAGQIRKRSHLVAAGDEVTLEVPEPRRSSLEPEAIPLAILYEDEDLIAIDKPAGLVVHPSPGHGSGTLVHALLHHVRDLRGIGDELRPGIVHRLDRDTSGVLLVAKTDRAHASLSRQMKKRTMGKEYVTLVAGIPAVRKGDVHLSIGRDPKDRKKMRAFRTIDPLPAGARTAQTLYEIEEEYPALALTLLRCRLVTGRTHQIRVHLAAARLPVVGDPVYGRPSYDKVKDPALRRMLEEFPRQALHAERISFRHPATNEPMVIAAPLPEDLTALLEAVRTAASPRR